MSFLVLNKKKILVDNIILVTLLIMMVTSVLFFQLIFIMSMAVYPMTCLLIHGFLKTHKGIFNKNLNYKKKVLNLIAGVIYILFSSLILILVFSQPHIPASYIIYFLALPSFLIGLAGFLKGLIVNIFSPLFRSLNMAFGILTIITTYFAILFADGSFIFCLCSLLIALALNSVLRSALYLSEYGLSLKSFRNFKLVFIIMEWINIENT